MRATLRLSSPAWFAQPRITSSMAAGSIPVRATSARRGIAARSSGRTRARAPPRRPTGVRTASTMYACLLKRASAQVHPDRLHLGVQLECVAAQLAPEAGLLVAAERRRSIERMIGVDPDRARLQGAREAVCTLHVRGPDTRGKPVHRAVRDRDRLVVVGEGDRGQHGSEDLLLRDRLLLRHTPEDRRLHPPAILVLQPLSAGYQLRALCAPLLDVADDALELFLGDDGAHATLRVQRLARLHEGRTLDQLLEQGIVHALVHEQTRSCRAALAVVVEDPGKRAAHR